MALDVYVGGFSRYFAREWENVAQKWARESGVEYEMIEADESEPVDFDAVAEAVGHWREALNAGLGTNLDEPLEWDESRTSPYFTDRPGYSGYGALLVWAAHTEAESTPPDRLEPDWYEDATFAEYSDPGKSETYRAILCPGLWLPGQFQFSFDFEHLTGDEVHITSNLALQEALGALNEQTFGLAAADLDARLEAGLVEGASLREMAALGLAMFTRLCEKSLEFRLPIMIDA